MNTNVNHREDGAAQPVIRRSRKFCVASASVFAIAVMTAPGRVFAQLDDVAPSNVGLPGAGLAAQFLGWGKWAALAICALAMMYGAATWRGIGGNQGRGVEGKMYVGAGAIGAAVVGVAIPAVNLLYGAGAAGA